MKHVHDESVTLSITGTTNDLVAVEVALCANKLEVYCRFLTSFVGTALCKIAYGTDPTRKQLLLIDMSQETGLSRDRLVITLTQLESNTLYYYNVTAKRGSMNVTVLGEFRTGVCTLYK